MRLSLDDADHVVGAGSNTDGRTSSSPEERESVASGEAHPVALHRSQDAEGRQQDLGSSNFNASPIAVTNVDSAKQSNYEEFEKQQRVSRIEFNWF